MKRFENLLVFGIDTGNYNIKIDSDCFTSGYKQIGKEAIFEEKLLYNGCYYALSDMRIPIRTDKTQTIDFLILSLFGLAKELRVNNVTGGVYDVALSVGLPPGYLSVAGMKDKLRAYYHRDLEFQVNDRLYQLNVKRVFVCPQGYAALMAPVQTVEMSSMDNPPARPIDMLHKEPEAILIDIGGGTEDVIGLRYGKPVPEFHDSIDKGVVRVFNDINTELRGTTGQTLSETAIKDLMVGAEVRIAPEDRQVIDKHIRRYGDEMLMRYSERQFPFRNSYVVLMGGGAKSVWDCWSGLDCFGKLDYIGDIRANAKGYEEMALAALSKR